MNDKLSLKSLVTFGLIACASCLVFATSSTAQFVGNIGEPGGPRVLESWNFYPGYSGGMFGPGQSSEGRQGPSPMNRYILPDGDVLTWGQTWRRGPYTKMPEGECDVVLLMNDRVAPGKAIKVTWPGPPLANGRVLMKFATSPAKGNWNQPTYPIRMKVDDLIRSRIYFQKPDGTGSKDVYVIDARRLFTRSDLMRWSEIRFFWFKDNLPRPEPGRDLRPENFNPRNTLKDGDIIEMTRVSGPSDATNIKITLESNRDVTSWKEIKLRLWTVKPDGLLVEPHEDVKPISVEGNEHGAGEKVSFIWNAEDFVQRGQLIFSKAKELGQHREVYTLWGSYFYEVTPPSLTFTWIKD